MKSNSLSLRDLVVAREGAALTPPINLTLEAGKLLAVRGDNGSGKSTFLKTLAGLIRPDSGDIRFNDQPISAHPIMYLGHKLGLSSGMSVYDNVALWARLHKVPELTAAAMHYFDLVDIANVPLHQLSAGWQQRVALTRLITVPSALWILDEPTSHLDAAGVTLLQTLLHSRLEQGGIAIIATHADLRGDFVEYMNINRLN